MRVAQPGPLRAELSPAEPPSPRCDSLVLSVWCPSLSWRSAVIQRARSLLQGRTSVLTPVLGSVSTDCPPCPSASIHPQQLGVTPVYPHLCILCLLHRAVQSSNTETSVLGTHTPQEVAKQHQTVLETLCQRKQFSFTCTKLFQRLNSLNCLTLEMPFPAFSKDKTIKIGNLKYRSSFQTLALSDDQLDCYLYCKQHRTNQ